jgi:hypothetical protein
LKNLFFLFLLSMPEFLDEKAPSGEGSKMDPRSKLAGNKSANIRGLSDTCSAAVSTIPETLGPAPKTGRSGLDSAAICDVICDAICDVIVTFLNMPVPQKLCTYLG